MERTIPGEYKETNINRNYPGFEKKQYYTLEEMVKGDEAGTTDTDVVTAGPEEKEGYSTINKKRGPGYHVPIKSSSARTTEN